MTVDTKQPFLTAIDQLDRSPRNANFQALRQTASTRFRELPFPTPRTEDWRFTNVAPLLQRPFAPAIQAPELDAALLPAPSSPDAVRLTFVNGWFAPKLSTLRQLPAGVAIGNLASAKLEETLQLARIAAADAHVFTALNTALLHDGAFVLVPDNVVVDRPIEFLYLVQPADRNLAITPRTLIVAGKNSRATFVERYLAVAASPRMSAAIPGGSEDSYFTNAVTEIALGDGAVIDHYKVQQESLQAYHIADTHVVLGAAANFTTHYVALGGSLVRNEVRVRFAGPNAEATVNGLYLAAGKQHLDNYTVIDHAVPNCASHELYKGVLADQAHGVFNGKIFVRQDAQKTDAKQTNNVLLLSDTATINTKPQLEIFADDVKCTHGATVGQLDADQIFYLQTRGITVEQARRLLTYAFANDIVSRIKIEAIRDQLENILVQRNM
jgi:Fe-S cluster assembly protein SufD